MTDILAQDGAFAAPPQPIPSRDTAPAECFRFTGNAREYFRIWIVNLFLTVLTLGLYSPWAKVRKKRYFYGSTWVAGANFEYHGNPVAILKGRLIAFAAFAAYTAASHFSPRIASAMLLAMGPALPWLLVQSFAFNAANSSYRNIRFRFSGSYREALAAIAPLAVVPLLGIAMPPVEPAARPAEVANWWYVLAAPLVFLFVYPYVIAKLKILHVRRSAFGAASFECDVNVARFYRIYIAGAFVFMGVMTIAGFLTALSMVVQPMLGVGLVFVGYLAGGALALAYVNASIANYLFGASRLPGLGRFRSDLKVNGLLGIYLGNLLAIALTFGLAVPWAAVRTARYRAQHLALEVDGGFASLAPALAANVAATGDQMGDMFGLDLSL